MDGFVFVFGLALMLEDGWVGIERAMRAYILYTWSHLDCKYVVYLWVISKRNRSSVVDRFGTEEVEQR